MSLYLLGLSKLAKKIKIIIIIITMCMVQSS